jgi:hypothetical protein
VIPYRAGTDADAAKFPPARDKLAGTMASSWLVQMLLPLYDNAGQRFGDALFAATRGELLDRFGGVTAFQRAPAHGLWETRDGAVATDDVAVFEVMTPELDRAWWGAYRQTLERRFRQEAIVVRALSHEML